jgi:hypothetical protein
MSTSAWRTAISLSHRYRRPRQRFLRHARCPLRQAAQCRVDSGRFVLASTKI